MFLTLKKYIIIICRITEEFEDGEILVKLDFNTIRRDTILDIITDVTSRNILDTVADRSSEMYKFVLAYHSYDSKQATPSYRQKVIIIIIIITSVLYSRAHVSLLIRRIGGAA